MSRASQHAELRQRHGKTDYRLFRPEEYRYPERIEATESSIDAELGFIFLNKPYRDENANERWLLASMHAHCVPALWKKGASLKDTKAAYSVWFGKGSEHNFASVVPLSDRSLNPLHKAEVDGLIALLLYIQDRKLDILRNVDLGKMVIMCNNVYVIGAITNNVRRWRETDPPFHSDQGTKPVANREAMMRLGKNSDYFGREHTCKRTNTTIDALMRKFEASGCQIELWYKAVDGNWAEKACLSAIEQKIDYEHIAF